ncbi:atypical kinase COQ8B, mitochondrial-like isoform X2 [Portunus trituberculatus]|nr:atypical kinase COQ8B, mitochondrial-like isoform X2 [Portunus trituberculatus]
MAKPPRSSDLVTVLRGLARVGSAAVDVRSQEITRAWATSSLRPAVLEGTTRLQETLTTVIQQPHTLQRNATKGVNEALARMSMVTEGLRVYNSSSSVQQPVTEFSEKFDSIDDALHNPKVEELNIEELLMQEASSEPALASLDSTIDDGLGRVQEKAGNIVDKARSVREEVSKRVEEFEPLLNIAKGEEKEITEENLEILDQKVAELEVGGFSHGQSFVAQEEAAEADLNQEIVKTDGVKKSPEHSSKVSASASTSPQELTIESLLMHETIDSSTDQLLSESQSYLYNEVEATAETVKRNVNGMGNEINQKVMEFEPLLDINNFDKHEITDEDLQVIDERLSDLQDVAFGHNLKIFKEIENPKPVEDVIHDIVESQTPGSGKTTEPKFEIQEKDLHNIIQREDFKEQCENPPELAEHSKDVTIELENSISQIAKPVIVDDSYTSTLSDMKVDVQMQPSVDVPQMEKNMNSETVSEGTPVETVSEETPISSVTLSSSDPILPERTGGVAVAPAVSSTVAAGTATTATAATAAAATSTVVTGAAAATATATGTTTTTTTFVAASNTEAAHESATTATAVVSSLVSSSAAGAVASSSVVSGAGATSADDDVSNTRVTRLESKHVSSKPRPKLLGKKPLAKEKPKSSLAENAQARKVPHSRISRLVSFGGLAAGLGMGTLAEVTRRSLGLRQGKNGGSLLDSSPFLTEANAKRIVDTLCKVRGAALKLGQMLSIQDSALINPQLQKIFERVRQSADFMPTWQLEETIIRQLGHDWRSMVVTFDEKPFAAASIGQVHLATLHDGRPVAMKIQYPGVAEGIESDINNLVSSLKVANIFPEGLFLDSVIEVAKKELRWECDYIREAECTKRFKELVKPHPDFYVPEVIPELSTPQIITTELIAGIPVDKCIEIDQESRNYICEKVLGICLMELFQFGFMQTDPNWSNFFYDAETEQLALLDFGACRDYDKGFVDKYLNLIHGAAVKDRDKVLKYSQELGFLTGYEAKVMIEAHIDAIMILGEAFQEDKPFNFGDQNTTYRIQHLVPVMISHRMCAPPEEIYSLHRKMSGVFLLCAKLKGVVNCYSLFQDILVNYKFGGTWEDFHAGKL